MAKEQLLPTARILRAIRNSSKRPAPQAFAEWVDNSIGENRGNAQNVYININGRQVQVADDGRGPDRLADVVQLGAGTISGGYDTGRFGWGGSVAQLAFADAAQLFAYRSGKQAQASIPWTRCVEEEFFPAVDSTYVSSPGFVATSPDGSELTSGLVMDMTFRKGKHVSLDNIRDHLAREFAPALLLGRHIWLNLEEVKAWEPTGLSDPVFQTFTVNRDDLNLRADLMAGWSDQLPDREMGLDIIYGPRRVGRTRKPLEGYRGYVIYGTLTLIGEDWLPLLEAEKTGIAEDDVLAQIEAKCRKLLMPLMDDLRAIVRNQALVDIGGDVAKAMNTLTAASGRTGTGEAKGFPDTTGWEVRGGTRKRRDGKAKKRAPAQRRIWIDGKDLVDHAWKADVPADGDWQIDLNESIPTIKRALEEMPPDRPLIHQLLGSAIATQLLADDPDLLWRLKIYDQGEYERLLINVGGTPMGLVPYVVATLMRAIDTSGSRA